MDLAGIRALLNVAVVATTVTGTKFIGKLELIPNSVSTVTLLPLDPATAAQNDYAINGVAALDLGSVEFMVRLANA
jgi:hypothetical protein